MPRRRQAPRRQARRAQLRLPLRSLALPSPRDLLALALHGRNWIAIVAASLIGLVTMQLIVLELNTSIGHSLQRATALQRENDSLAIVNSEAASGESVEALARGLGMIGVAPGELHFVHAMPLRQAGRVADMLLSTKPFAAGGIGSSIIGGSGASASGFVTSSGGETTLPPTSEGQVAAAAEASPTASTQLAGAEEAATAGTAGATTSGGGATGQGASTAAPQGSQGAGTGQVSGAAGEAGEPAASVSAAGGIQAGAGG